MTTGRARLHVALVLPGFAPPGQQWALPAMEDYAGAIARRTDLEIVTLRYPAQGQSYKFGQAHIHPLGHGDVRLRWSPRLWVAAWAKIAQLHRRQAFDVVHAFWANEAGFVGTVAGRALGIPTVVSLAGGELVGFPELGYGSQLVLAERWQVRAALGLATCVTAGSTYMHALCRRLAPKAAGLRVMSMGVDLARFERRAWPAHSLGLHLLCVGSLVPIKRHGLVLKAFSLLRRAVPSARLTMVGNGPLATEVGEQIDHLGLGEVVTMAGHIDHSRMCDVYAAAHVLVVASLHEAQCMAVLEAAACGRPAIGSSVGALADLHPTGAVAVDGLDAHSLASAIQHTAAEAARLEELGSAAHKLVARHHSLDVATERFATLYSTLADG